MRADQGLQLEDDAPTNVNEAPPSPRKNTSRYGDDAAWNIRPGENETNYALSRRSSQSDESGLTTAPKGRRGYADGGLVTDDDSDDDSTSLTADPTTDAVSKALKTINSVLMYGRQKNGLPGDDSSQNASGNSDSGGAIPDDQSGSDSSDAGDDTPSFAEGGPVEEGSSAAPDDTELAFYGMSGQQSGQEDMSGAAAPVVSQGGSYANSYDPNADQSGIPAIPVDDAQQGGQQGDQDYVNPPPGNAVQRIMNYLTGGDAMSPQQFDKYMAQTRENANTPSENTLLAAQAATDSGGPDEGFGFLQAARKIYDKMAGVGRSAADQGDVQSAATAANKAFAHVPGQYSAEFTPVQGGVTATVKDVTTGKVQQQPMTAQQLGQLLDTRSLGQWDHLMERGVPGAMKYVSQAPAGSPTRMGGAPGASNMSRAPASSVPRVDSAGLPHYDEPGEEDSVQRLRHDRTTAGPNSEADREVNMGHDVTLLRSPKYARLNPKKYNESISAPANTDPNAVRIRQWNGGETSGEGIDPDKNKRDRIAEIEARNQGRMDVAQARNTSQEKIAQGRREGAMDVAKLRDAGYARAQQQKAQIALQRMAQQSRDANERNRANVGMRLLSNPNWATQSADERNAILKQYGLDHLTEPPAQQGQAPQAPQPQTPKLAQQQGASSVPPANQRVTGQVYSTPKGQFRWMGNGWQPAASQ